MPEGLKWPPRKEDLERLYLGQRLSAAKVAEAYGLKSANPKSSETLVLYHLRKFGIARRDRAEHIRKVTSQMVDGWVMRYEAGESLKQIAGSEVDNVTVWNHLKKRGVVLRDKVEAQIKAVTKYEKRPFDGDEIEKAYLVGLRYGDLHAVRHGRAIRVRVSTTHPAMADLFGSAFSSYGHVHRYPRQDRLVGYEWTLECDLDQTFEFPLSKPSIEELKSLSLGQFIAFSAGLFDAEGSILMHKKEGRYNPEVAISNSAKELVDYLFLRFRAIGFSAHVFWRRQKEDRDGITGESLIGRVVIWKFEEAQRFLRMVQLKHREKIAKSELARALIAGYPRSNADHVLMRWTRLTEQIQAERRRFLQLAASAIAEEELDLGRTSAEEADSDCSSMN